MKKLLAVLMACVLLCSSALAAEMDWSAMSVSELQDVINEARNEILGRTARNDGNLFVAEDPEGLQIYITGKGETDWSETYQLEAVVINGTEQAFTITFDNVVINGWETEPFGNQIQNIGAGKKKKGSIPLSIKDAELTSLDQIEEVEISFHTFNPVSYETIRRYGPYTFYYDGSSWYGGAGATQTETRTETVVNPLPETDASGLEGTWKLTDARPGNTSEEEAEYIRMMIGLGLVDMTFTFKGNRVIGSMSALGDEEHNEGTYVIEGNTLIISNELDGTLGGPIEFKVDGDTLEMTFPEGVMIFTRQQEETEAEDAGTDAADDIRETVEGAVEDAKETVEGIIEDAGGVAEAVQESVADAANKVEEIREQIGDKMEEIRDKVEKTVDGIQDVINRLTNP